MLYGDVVGINSKAIFKLANNSRQDLLAVLHQALDTFFRATFSDIINEIVTGQCVKATLYPLLEDQLEVFAKRVKYCM